MKKVQKNITKNKKANGGNASYLWILLGVLIAAILLLVQTGFKEFFKLERSGYAITDAALTQSLLLEPENEKISKAVNLRPFEESDIVYSQGNSLFLGEKKKVLLQNAYPLYLSDTASIQLLNDSAKLLTNDFEKVDTYQGLILLNKYAYNRDGLKADAAEYWFLRLSNGNFINLAPITYSVKGEDYDIDVNSIVHFEKNYLSYYEVNKEGRAIYKSRAKVSYQDRFFVDGVEYSYEELLLLLEIIQPEVVREDSSEEISEIPVSEEPPIVEEVPSEEVTTSEHSSEEEVTEEPEMPSEVKKKDRPERPAKEKKQNTYDGPRGVRPDSMRPDKNNGDADDNPLNENYEKPSVTVQSYEAGTYHISMRLAINDPAERLNASKKVQIEVFEVNGTSRRLVMRSYKAAPGGGVILGDGSIKPSTTYEVKTTLFYNDEHDDVKSEVIDTHQVTTNSFESLGVIKLSHHQGDAFHNKIQISDICFTDGTDREAVYGIARSGGIQISIEKNGAEKANLKLSSSNVEIFKSGNKALATTAPVLEAKTTYEYNIKVTDYFGNVFRVENAEGTATTCKNPPKAEITLEKNEISDIDVSVQITDEDFSFLPRVGTEDKVDVYFAVTKTADRIESVEELLDPDNEMVCFYMKLPDDEYTYQEVNGFRVFHLVDDQIQFNMQNLRLDERYEIHVLADYDLDNHAGEQRFAEIGVLEFKAAGLSKLGAVYINGAITDVTANGVEMRFSLNRARTDSELVDLLTDFHVDIVTTSEEGDDDNDNDSPRVGFAKDSTDSEGRLIYELFRNDTDFLAKLENELESMTEYQLKPSVLCTYLGEDYDIKAILNISGFKTLRATPVVEVIDPIFAGGQLVFDTSVLDEDEAITGNSGSKAIVTLYSYTQSHMDENGVVQVDDPTFVKKVRIPKSTDRDQMIISNLIFDNLDMGLNYYVAFTAIEYNNGYKNDTFKSNYELHRYYVPPAINYTGKIRMQDLRDVSVDTSIMRGDFKVTFTDPEDKIADMSAVNEDYFISVSRMAEDLTTVASTETVGYAKDADADDISWQHDFLHGNYTYKVILFVKQGNRDLKLDEITFTTEQKITGISSTYELIDFIKKDPKGKYVATQNIELISEKKYYPIDGDSTSGVELTGNQITTIFNGQLDFQGFTLAHHYCANGQRMFNNIGPNGKLTNLVYDIYWDCTSTVYDDGCVAYRNYGTISDIRVNYRGGAALANTVVGVLARTNAATGVIENFVINHNPDPGKSGFSVKTHGGLLCYANYGIVRNGYAYGEDLFCAHYTEKSVTNRDSYTDRYVGGLVGYNITVGQITNVYSLVGLQMESFINEWPGCRLYGSIVGYSSGYTGYMYSTEENSLKLDRGPTVGLVSGRKYENVYYYSNVGRTYTAAWSKQASLESLYDTGWQKKILGNQFSTSNVETGFYPHVYQSYNLPHQDYIPLPEHVSGNLVDIAQAEVLSYDNTEGNESALVKFRFSNSHNAQIQTVMVDGLSLIFDFDTESSEDGYTTIQAVVSNPTKYKSSYNIKKIGYSLNGRGEETNYTAGSEPQLIVDFYRNINNADDWYTYVVKMARDNTTAETQENVRLRSDIDFEGVNASRIRVDRSWWAKIDGAGHTIKNIDLIASFNVRSNWYCNCLFNASRSLEMSGSVRNLTIENYTSGGQYLTYSAYQCGVFRYVYGDLDNVHLINATMSGYDSMGGLASRTYDGAVISNCTVNNLTMTYQEPKNSESDCWVGGIAGYAGNTRINNCYVKNINIKATDAKTCYGVGGICGYTENSVIDSVYATGDIEARGNKVGGIVGQYKCTDEAVVCLSNALAKVNIIGYTDMIGGLVGCANITSNMISDTNNISGVAFGNVYAYNPDATGVSHTVGSIVSRNIKFFGCETQLVNGAVSTTADMNTRVCRGLISYEEAKNPRTYTDTMEFTGVYNFDPVTSGYLPHLYYSGTTRELPYQGCEGYDEVVINDQKTLGIEVRDVVVDVPSRTARINMFLEEGWSITDVAIDMLKYEVLAIDPSLITPGAVSVLIQYEDEARQNHFLDSYVLTSVTATKDGSETILPLACRIPVTMYKDISTSSEWCAINTEYENYRIINDLDFAGLSGYGNKKIGRVMGRNINNSVNGNRANLSNIAIRETGSDFIARLNSSMMNLSFENVTIENSGKNCLGIIGTSYGKVENINFKDISIKPTGTLNYAGIIAYQNGSAIKDVKCENINVNAGHKTVSYVGTLVGHMVDIGSIENIEVKNGITYGDRFVGGLAGVTYRIDIKNVLVQDATVTGLVDYTGGMVGLLGQDGNCIGAVMENIQVIGSMTNPGSASALGKTVTIKENGVERVTVWGAPIFSGATGTTTVKGVTSVGGMAGRSYVTTGKNVFADEPYATVSGCNVIGKGSYVGGMYGYQEYYSYHTRVRDSYISVINSDTSKSYESVGGQIGRSVRTNYYADVWNCLIETQNCSQVGGVAGSQTYNELRYSNVANCNIVCTAGTTAQQAGKFGYVGGTVGYVYGGANVFYNGVMNTTIQAQHLTDVGGIIGRFNAGIGNGNYCGYNFCVGDFDTAQSTTLEAAMAKPQYYIKGYTNVGGIVGYLYSGRMIYCESNMNVIGSETNSTSAAGGLTGFYHNGFVQNSNNTVTYSSAYMFNNYFAGTVQAAKYAGGLCGLTGLTQVNYKTNAERVVGSTGGSAEGNYTYSNLLLPYSIKATNARAVAGDCESYVARSTRVWADSKLNDEVAYDKMTGYSTWKESSDSGYGTVAALRIVTSADLQNWKMYYNMKWIGGGPNYSGVWRTMIPGLRSGLNNGYTDTITKKSLPVCRLNASTSKASDAAYYILHTENQFIQSVYPSDSSASAVTSWIPVPQSTRTYALRSRSINAGGGLPQMNVYASDADKINVEFDKAMVMQDVPDVSGYFKVTVDGADVIEKMIEQRVYTLSYNYSDDITITYGEAHRNEDGTYEYYPYGDMDLCPQDVSKRILVSSGKFYYIGDNGLVEGDADTSSVIGQDYVHLMNGCAINQFGDVTDLTTNSQINTVTDIEVKDLKPLVEFDYDGYHIRTYQKFSEIVGSNTVERPYQMFLYNHVLYMVDGNLENVKDAILIYKSEDLRYQTILGNDGKIVDMIQETPIFPEGITNSGIKDMTNNLYATAPYALIEYSNGGFAGYNYLTGEILFDETRDNITLTNYLFNRVFGEDDNSLLGGIFSTFRANEQLSESIHSSQELDTLVGSVQGSANGIGLVSSAQSYNFSGEVTNGEGLGNTPSGERVAIATEMPGNTLTETAGEAGVIVDGSGSLVGNGTGSVNGMAGNNILGGQTNGEAEQGTNGSANSNNNEGSTENRPDADGDTSSESAGSSGTTERNNEQAGNNSSDTQETASETKQRESSTATTTSEITETVVREDANYMILYNASTGVYEIVNETQFLENQSYQSENARLGVENLAEYNGYAIATNVKKDANGLTMYIMIALATLLGVSALVFVLERKKQR